MVNIILQFDATKLIPWLQVNVSRDYLRNKSWKPECVLSLNMGWRILVFYPKLKFTNIRQPMLTLKAHSGFHELFRF
jgi:hypothetical protein